MEQNNAISSLIANEKPRDYLMDNVRAILIILVVLGHILSSMRYNNELINSIYIFIYTFHMPAMVFISGYFSKNPEKIRRNAFVTILIPYLILNIVSYIYKLLVIKVEFYPFHIFKPSWGLWYLLALFFWKFSLKDLLKLRHLFLFSFVFAVLCGFSKEFDEYMALARTACFLPFFVLGNYCRTGHIARIRKLPKALSCIILVAVAAVSVYASYMRLFDTEALYFRSPYPEDSPIKSMLVRIILYLIAFCMILVLINLVSMKKTFLSYVGRNTMTVYVLHLFVIPILEKLELLKDRPYLYLIYSVIMTAVLVFLFTRGVVRRAYDFIMDKLSGFILKDFNILKPRKARCKSETKYHSSFS